jgi:hypothetical protein
MKTKILFIPIVISALLVISLVGCDDSGNAPGKTTGPKPNIQFKAGSVYYYGTDTITQDGISHPTKWRTRDDVLSETSFNGRTCFPITSVTVDTTLPIPIPITSQTLYVSYDANSGQFFQWGVKKIFDPSQTATWDMVADFSQTLGTSVALFTITNLFGQPLLSANVTSAVMYDTTFTTTGAPGVNVSCYKVAVVADVLASSISIGKVYLDYYVGYTPSSNPNNPSGRIRIKIYPINLAGGYPAGDGLDQKLNRFTIP